MKRTFLAKLGRKSHDKISPNYRFIVHLAGKFLSSFKKYVKCEISNDHFSYNFSTGALFVVSTYKVPLLKDLLSRSGGLFAFHFAIAIFRSHTRETSSSQSEQRKRFTWPIRCKQNPIVLPFTQLFPRLATVTVF